jgi:hypothetical protein
MPTTDRFSQQLGQLLDLVSDASLPEMQQRYRETIVRMGLLIGEKFQELASLGPDRLELAGTGVIHGPGPRYNALVIAEFALNIRPAAAVR